MNATLHENMSFAEYRALPGVNCSTLKHGLRSMAHLRWALDNPSEPTPAMALGTAFHVLTTEPQEFENRYLVGGPINPRTGKPFASDTKAFAEWVEANGSGKTVITESDYAGAQNMAAAIRRLPLMEAILGMRGLMVEPVVQWLDEDTGILCKARLDLLLDYTDPIVIPDLKSTQDARPGPFSCSCVRYAYHMQAAMYSDAVLALIGEEPRFIFACVESSPPYCAAVHELAERSIDTGRRQYTELLQRYAECERCGEWPGYPTDLNYLYLPKDYEERA